MILALDLGTQAGWAVSGNPITSGTVNLKSRRFEGGGMRFLRFRRWLYEIIETAGRPEEVVFEEVRRHMGVDAAHVYGGLLAVVSAFCEEREIPYRGIPIGTWKKALTGKGNASKDIVMASVRQKGFKPGSQDEADAIGVLLVALEEAGK